MDCSSKSWKQIFKGRPFDWGGGGGAKLKKMVQKKSLPSPDVLKICLQGGISFLVLEMKKKSLPRKKKKSTSHGYSMVGPILLQLRTIPKHPGGKFYS